MGKKMKEDEIKYVVSAETEEAQKEIHSLTAANKKLKEEERARKKTMIDLEAQGKKTSIAYSNLKKESEKYTAEIKKNEAQINKLSKGLDLNSLTMVQLKKRAKDLRIQLNNLSQGLHPEKWAATNKELKSVEDRMDQLRTNGRRVNSEFGSMENMMGKMKVAVKAFIAVKVIGWLKSVHDRAYETRKEFAKYEAVLRNTFQSQKKANEAMKSLQRIASDTPYSLKIWTENYVKLVNRGIKPTNEELVKMGDLAASQGKSVDQLVEAVLDAMTGENERLKEFGIKASKSGDKTKFTFRGVTTEVKNSESAIKDYLLSLGEIEGVSGSMAVQMNELEGIQSNLGDTMDSFFNKVGKKLEPFWKNMMKYASEFFNGLSEFFTTYTESYENHFDKMVELESSMPALLSRYDELQSKSAKSAAEQKELASVISKIRDLVPGAVSAFDEYGNAISISADKVEDFLRKNRALLLFENKQAIKETTEQLEYYRKKYKALISEQQQGGRSVVQSNGMFAAPMSYINTKALPQINEDIKKYGELVRGAEEKLKELNGNTIEDAIKKQQDLFYIRKTFYKMDQRQLEAWIRNNKEAYREAAEMGQEIYDERFPAIDPDAAKAAAEKAAKAALSASEKEKKAVLDTERDAIDSLESLREESLQKQQQYYNTSIYAFNADLSENLISKEQHNMLILDLDKKNAEDLLQIEKSYYDDANSIVISNSELKENIIQKSNQRVIAAEKKANDAKINLQLKMNSLIKDFKSEFKVSSIDEDYQMQLEVLNASYRAKKEQSLKDKSDSEELDKAYFRAKEQLESDYMQRIQSIRDQYGLSNQQEQFNAELEQLKSARDQQLLTEQEYETAVQNLKRDSYKKQFDYYSDLFSGAVQSLQNAEMSRIDAKYDAEISAAKGNAEQIERLEDEKEAKKLEVQKKYADVNFAVKASQIIADTAVAIMKARADLGPIAGAVAAALTAITGAAQLASANAERQKIKNLTVSGSSSSTGTRVATGRESGGFLDVEREQDGKLFRAGYEPTRRGYIDRPTVIVGEGPTGQSKEWVASNAAVNNPTIAPILDLIDHSQRAGTIRTLDLNAAMKARMAGYASGGNISDNNSTHQNATPYVAGLSAKEYKDLSSAINRLVEFGVPASVVLTDFERKQKARDRARKIGSKK
ncbi:MAG: hypothetical protein WCR36_03410 [Bacteroidaceae bacterium]